MTRLADYNQTDLIVEEARLELALLTFHRRVPGSALGWLDPYACAHALRAFDKGQPWFCPRSVLKGLSAEIRGRYQRRSWRADR